MIIIIQSWEKENLWNIYSSEKKMASAAPYHILYFFFFMQITLTEKWIVLFQDL